MICRKNIIKKMGICGSKTEGSGDMLSKAKEMAFSMMVKSGGGAENDNQFSSLKKMVTDKFPKANIKQEIDVNSSENTFDVEMDGQKIHSQATDGTVEQNKTGIMKNIQEILMKKMKTAF